jgi:tetratricopeptide (TPR) repeat protein
MTTITVFGLSISIRHVHRAVILILAFIIYSNTFNVPFVWDDERLILNNPIIKDGRYSSEKAEKDEELNKLNKQRFVLMLSFSLNYKINGFDTFWFHAVNLSIHIINALIVYSLILNTCRTPYLRGSPSDVESETLAFATALLFAVHPIQTEAVTYIFQRAASLSTFFYLLSVTLYVKARISADVEITTKTKLIPVYVQRRFLYASALAATAAGMFSKETAFTIPVMITMYEAIFFKGSIFRRSLRLVPFWLTLLIIPVHYLYGLGRSLESSTHEYSFITHDRLEYLVTQFVVIAKYIRLLLLPIHQNLDYDLVLFRTFTDSTVYLSFLLIAATVISGILLLRYSNPVDLRLRLAAFGIFWFYIGLSVESSVIPLRLLICEYRLYLPSVGFFLAVISLVLVLFDHVHIDSRHIGVSAIGVIVLSCYAYAAYARNGLWADQIAFWEYTSNESPKKFLPYYNLAVEYNRHNRLADATKALESALRLNPLFPPAHGLLASVYRRLGRASDAERESMLAYSSNRDSLKGHHALGIYYSETGRYEDAVVELKKAIDLNPQSDQGYADLAIVYCRQGRFDDAIQEFRKALSLNPGFSGAHNGLGMVFGEMGKWPDAIREFKTALQNDPQDIIIRENLGVAYFNSGKYADAEKELRYVLQIEPGSVTANNYMKMMGLMQSSK